jgi:hypothetical protein
MGGRGGEDVKACEVAAVKKFAAVDKYCGR